MENRFSPGIAGFYGQYRRIPALKIRNNVQVFVSSGRCKLKTASTNAKLQATVFPSASIEMPWCIYSSQHINSTVHQGRIQGGGGEVPGYIPQNPKIEI